MCHKVALMELKGCEAVGQSTTKYDARSLKIQACNVVRFFIKNGGKTRNKKETKFRLFFIAPHYALFFEKRRF